MTPTERARVLVARYDHSDASELSGMCADTRRIAAIAAAGLGLRDSLSVAAGAYGYTVSYAPRVIDAVAAFDAAIAQAMAEGERE